MKKWRTILIVLLIVVLLVPFSMPVCAKNSVSISSGSIMASLSDEERESVSEGRKEFLFHINNGDITIESDGKYILCNSNSMPDDLKNSIVEINKLIDVGLIRYKDGSYSCPLEEICTDSSFVITQEDNISFVEDDPLDIAIPYGPVHECDYSYLNLGALVRKNTKDVRGCFLAMAKVNPSIAFSSAIGYWVGKVREGGDWDYKLPSKYGPYDRTYCCTYGKNNSKMYRHRTAEYIGNYNYGYTGSILFGLDVLKFGSGAAAGFDFEKDADDYPAITEGYNDAKACGEYLDQ